MHQKAVTNVAMLLMPFVVQFLFCLNARNVQESVELSVIFGQKNKTYVLLINNAGFKQEDLKMGEQITRAHNAHRI